MSQKQLEFRVRKGLRSGSKAQAEPVKSPLKRTRFTRRCRIPDEVLQCSPPKKSKVVVAKTEPPQASPLRKPLARMELAARIPLSPRKDLENAIITPTERPIPRGAIRSLSKFADVENKPTPDQNCRISPAKIRALAFQSPTKDVSTPEKIFSPGFTTARALTFSPRKQFQDENFLIPAQSPVKRPMGQCYLSPTKSPRKRLMQDENSLSPRKSPRKSLLASPRKAFASTLRLAKQEGM